MSTWRRTGNERSRSRPPPMQFPPRSKWCSVRCVRLKRERVIQSWEGREWIEWGSLLPWWKQFWSLALADVSTMVRTHHDPSLRVKPQQTLPHAQNPYMDGAHGNSNKRRDHYLESFIRVCIAHPFDPRSIQGWAKFPFQSLIISFLLLPFTSAWMCNLGMVI